MTMAPLRATAFRGDPDIDELHDFFRPDHHFVGDTKWSFGTSLKSAYVNCFDFMNHTPVVQLWRDRSGEVQAVSRLSLGTGEWFHLAKPAYRDDVTTALLIAHAENAFALLSDHERWRTVRYESCTADIALLEQLGYERDAVAEVYMMRPLDGPGDAVSVPAGVQVDLLDQDNVALVHDRAMAQIETFNPTPPGDAERAWIMRSLPHQLRYGRPATNPHIVAIQAGGQVAAFADVFFDHTNGIGEFEPVGTRPSLRKNGLAKAVLSRGLAEMKAAGMNQAVVRTGRDNHAAIAAYESVGFETVDLLVTFTQQRAW